MDKNLQEVIPEQTKMLADFRQYLVDDGKAERTVQSYVTDVFHFMSQRGPGLPLVGLAPGVRPPHNLETILTIQQKSRSSLIRRGALLAFRRLKGRKLAAKLS